MTAVTVVTISASYSQIIELFPTGGGGYVVATKLLGPVFGLVSGCALVVDYMLTISISISSGVEAVLSFLPPGFFAPQADVHPARHAGPRPAQPARRQGVRDHADADLPVLLRLPRRAHPLRHLLPRLGDADPLRRHHPGDAPGHPAARLRGHGLHPAPGLQPRRRHLHGHRGRRQRPADPARRPGSRPGKKTMALMAASLSFTAGGLLVCYLLTDVQHVAGKTLNASLIETLVGTWKIGGFPLGVWLLGLILVSEGAILFVAAQTGFIDGPRVLGNMAIDSWVPNRFMHLSERLVVQNGILFMGAGRRPHPRLHAGLGPDPRRHVQHQRLPRLLAGPARHVPPLDQDAGPHRGKKLTINLVGFLMSAVHPGRDGGHQVQGGRLDHAGHHAVVHRRLRPRPASLQQGQGHDEAPGRRPGPGPADGRAARAAGPGRRGPDGRHVRAQLRRAGHPLVPQHPPHLPELLQELRLHLHRGRRLEELQGRRGGQEPGGHIREELKKYVRLSNDFGFHAESIHSVDVDTLDVVEERCEEIQRKYNKAVFFVGKLVFEEENLFTRFLHNQTAFSIQRILQFKGIPTIVLPIRVIKTQIRRGQTYLPSFSARNCLCSSAG
ncbi:MAG: hypothetical protein MZV70_71160 [Desulfobacterales bacterium]|nr:hypothetical protein [Desulfobacterales bacterium]